MRGNVSRMLGECFEGNIVARDQLREITLSQGEQDVRNCVDGGKRQDGPKPTIEHTFPNEPSVNIAIVALGLGRDGLVARCLMKPLMHGRCSGHRITPTLTLHTSCLSQ
jgi:hypothetical protein